MSLLQPLAQTFATRFADFCVPRQADSHKGSYGNVYTIGSAIGMSGAIVLSSSAALLMGCGKSHAIFCQSRLPIALIPQYPEIILSTIDTCPTPIQAQAIVIGCGMGCNEQMRNLLQKIISQQQNTLIFDADALNLLATYPELAQQVTTYSGNKILTPHPLEAARLLQTSVAKVQQNRLTSAQRLAEQFSAFVVLKGHHSLIVCPDKRYIENDSGNAGLATAGSGDVLSGMIAGFIAQYAHTENPYPIALEQILHAAIWLHGAAAEWLGEGLPLAGLLASEIAPTARKIRHLATKYAYQNTLPSHSS